MMIFPLEKSLVAAVLASAIIGCAPKPKPAPERERATAGIATVAPQTGESGDDARRLMMLRRAKETFRPIYFPYDRASLDEQSKAVLVVIKSFMLEFPEVQVVVDGHADERGTNDYNLALGESRANAVAAYLAQLGVPKGSLKTVSYGEEKPAQEGQSEAQWSLNRRAEFSPGL